MPAIITKKRKRDTRPGAPGLDAMEIFKRHFETQFAPLKGSAGKPTAKKAKADEAEREWEGLPDTDAQLPDPPAPEIVEFDASKDPLAGDVRLPNRMLKSFMSSRPPAADTDTGATKTPRDDEADDEDPAAETALLKNDLALQRLLRESHLLDASAPTLEATGKNRLKAIESRVQALGGRDITVQKHPMAVRKGMDAAKRLKEEKRRRHAKEAGIVLEKEVRVKKVSEREKTRDRGFGPSVGRFRNGTLVLSKRDVMDIEGRTGGGGGKGGRGGGKASKSGRGGKGGKKRR